MTKNPLSGSLAHYQISLRVCRRLRERLSEEPTLHPQDLNRVLEGLGQVVGVLKRYEAAAKEKAVSRPIDAKVVSFEDVRAALAAVKGVDSQEARKASELLEGLGIMP